MIPFSSDVATAAAVSMGVSNVQNTVRTPPTLWQYPGKIPVTFLSNRNHFSFFLKEKPCFSHANAQFNQCRYSSY